MSRRLEITATALLLALSPGCAVDGGTLVALTFGPTLDEAPVGSHYELFATINGSAVSLKKWVVRALPVAGGAVEKQVMEFLSPGTVLGIVDRIDELLRPVGGVRFRLPDDLRGATELYVTRESDEDTDPVPSGDVVMVCRLRASSRSILDGTFTSVDDKSFIQGTAALVLPDDGINSL